MSARRRAALLLCAACLAVPPRAWAQSPPAAAANGNPAQPRATEPPAYVDKLIGGGELPPLPAASEDTDYNVEGFPRYFRVEAVASSISGTGNNSYQNGIRFTGYVDTPSYGVLSADASLQNGGGASTLTVSQRGMPFDGGWFANNTLGVTYTPGIDLTRQQYRFYMPTFPIVGGTTEWLRTNELQLQAAVGQAGNFDGILLPGFSSLNGSIALVGGQWNFAPQWSAGFEVTSSSDVELTPGLAGPGNTFSGQSFYGTAAWQGESTRLQLNLLDTQGDQGRSGTGVWLDARTRVGRYLHHYGVYRLDPNLYFGYQQISSDQEGAYYRVNYQSQQFLWDATVEGLKSVSGLNPNTLYGSASVNYLIDPRTSVGASASVRQYAGTAWGTQVFGEKMWDYGTSRLQFSAAAQDRDDNGEQLQFDHTWNMPLGARLSTGVAVSREVINGSTFHTGSVLLYGGGNITDNLTLDGNARVNYTNGNGNGVGAYINANATWKLDSHWSVVATAYDNRDDTAKLFVLQAPSQDLTPIPVQRSRAFFITIRYEDRAGSARAPLGGPPGAGAGSLSGTIFLDANDDGRRNGNEQGAPNVTVLLDGRFAARTDAQGRFEFPLVAAGTHSITVVPDNLPLPWSISQEGRREVTVRTRESMTLDIPATRLR